MSLSNKTKLYNAVYGILLLLMLGNVILAFYFLPNKTDIDITVEILVQETLITIGFLLLSIHHFYNTMYFYGFLIVFLIFFLRVAFVLALFYKKYTS